MHDAGIRITRPDPGIEGARVGNQECPRERCVGSERRVYRATGALTPPPCQVRTRADRKRRVLHDDDSTGVGRVSADRDAGARDRNTMLDEETGAHSAAMIVHGGGDASPGSRIGLDDGRVNDMGVRLRRRGDRRPLAARVRIRGDLRPEDARDREQAQSSKPRVAASDGCHPHRG